jgi:hypothetical protein
MIAVGSTGETVQSGPLSWQEMSRQHLLSEVGRVRAVLLRRVEEAAEGVIGLAVVGSVPLTDSEQAQPWTANDRPSALERLCEDFDLSGFERDVLLLCAAMELDPAFARLCAAAQRDGTGPWPTFGLAVEALDAPEWEALAPGAPLRRWRLVEVGQGDSILHSPLRIDERILHFLMGSGRIDDRLDSFLEPVLPPSALPFSYQALAERIVAAWSEQPGERIWPAIELSGDASGGKRLLAAAACGALGVRLYALRATDLPTGAAERDAIQRLWEREAVLTRSALLVDQGDISHTEISPNIVVFIQRLCGLVVIAAKEPVDLAGRPVVRITVNRPDADEQQALWEHALGPVAAGLNGHLAKVAAQFPLDISVIDTAARTVREAASAGGGDNIPALLWEACRCQNRPPLESLAERFEACVTWGDIVLPEQQMQLLRDLAGQVRQRNRVYENWGFASKGTRGLGIAALFAGPSGTGKTLAAEVIASELSLDLYRIDLSQVVSKYIGETEKNLRHIFDAAEAGGAVLLFDEADALFGKRSEVKDSHDRYANIEVSYLLQRMEAYRGLAILTTNQRASLDTAFLRRLRFIITFPFPDAVLREEIWKRVFPPQTPTHDLDYAKLSRLNVSGGGIRSIALNAAFVAAEEDVPVSMRHILRTARAEYAKMEKALTEAEIGGWTQ